MTNTEFERMLFDAEYCLQRTAEMSVTELEEFYRRRNLKSYGTVYADATRIDASDGLTKHDLRCAQTFINRGSF